MKRTKARSIWPFTFFLLISSMILVFAVFLLLVLQHERTAIRVESSSRTRFILAVSQRVIESTVQYSIADMELLLRMANLEGPESEIDRLLDDFLDKYRMVRVLHLADSEGRIIRSYPDLPELDGIDITGTGYYQEWLVRQDTLFHGREMVMALDEPASTVITFFGGLFLIAHFDFSRSLAGTISHLVDIPGVEIALHDEHGIYLLSSDGRKVAEHVRNPFSKTIAEGYTGGIQEYTLGHNGHRITATVVEILDMEWYLGLYTDETVYQRESLRSLRKFLPPILLFLLVLTAVSLLTTRFATNPIRCVTRQLEQEAHSADFRFSLTGYREIDSLVTEMNTMLSALEEQLSELKKARNDAQVANRAKIAFLANISHEILTPLNGICGINDLLHETDIGDDGARLLSLQNPALDELRILIGDILDYSHLEAGNFELDIREFQPFSLVNDVLDGLYPMILDKGLSLHRSIRLQSHRVATGDPNRIRQILVQIMTNAIKFTDNGGIDVDVYSRDQYSLDETMVFVVRDSGRGIPDGQLEWMTAPFTQGEDPGIKTFRGSGLGLAFVRLLTENLGGEMTIASQLGSGTEVTISLPFRAWIEYGD